MKRQGPLTEPDAAYVFKQARQARALDFLAIIAVMNIICSFDIISISQRLWSFASLLNIEFATVVSHCLSASGRFWNGTLALHAKTLFSNAGLWGHSAPSQQWAPSLDLDTTCCWGCKMQASPAFLWVSLVFFVHVLLPRFCMFLSSEDNTSRPEAWECPAWWRVMTAKRKTL